MKKKVELYVFRHGETDWNARNIFQGHTDIALNSKGRAQANILIEKFQGLQPEVCLSSDLQRAVETAKIGLQNHSLTFSYSENLRETHLGDAEGMHRQAVIDKYGSELLVQFLSLDKKHLSASFPNGETKINHLIRLHSHIKKFVEENTQYRRIAISTHGGSLVRLVHACVNAPKELIAIPNCCLYHLEYHPGEDIFKLAGQL